jgi:hypothetical protein
MPNQQVENENAIISIFEEFIGCAVSALIASLSYILAICTSQQ